MSWIQEALDALGRNEPVTVRPRGHSMRGRVEDGETVTLVPARSVAIGDVVFVKWKGSALLHLALELDGDRVLIGNAKGGVNGWAPLRDVLGRLMPHPLVDIGVNLAHKSFDLDRADVLQRAAAAGVETLIVTGTTPASSRAAAWLAKEHPGRLYATAGIHPHHAKDFVPAHLDELEALNEQPGVVAVGECGLDFNRGFSPPKAQLECLEAQLELAAGLQQPVFLHERDAYDAMRGVLERHRPRIPRAVVHCFTADRRALDTWLDMDLHIGITGWICDERRGRHLVELVKHIPEDKLMLETDAPFLTPPGAQTRRNEPAFLPRVLEAVAKARGQTPAEVAAFTTRTARAFFGL